MDCSPPGSSVHEISQARILEWVAISFSKVSSWPRDQTWVSFFFSDLSFLHLLQWQVDSLPLAPPGKPLWSQSLHPLKSGAISDSHEYLRLESTQICTWNPIVRIFTSMVFKCGWLKLPSGFDNVWRYSWLSQMEQGRRVVLISNKKGPGMQLNILQCTRQTPQQRIFIQLQMWTVLRLRTPAFLHKVALDSKIHKSSYFVSLNTVCHLPRMQSTVFKASIRYDS